MESYLGWKFSDQNKSFNLKSWHALSYRQPIQRTAPTDLGLTKAINY